VTHLGLLKDYLMILWFWREIQVILGWSVGVFAHFIFFLLGLCFDLINLFPHLKGGFLVVFRMWHGTVPEFLGTLNRTLVAD